MGMIGTVSGSKWLVAVRLPDGSNLYFSPGSDRQGQSDWSPRRNQAQRFETEVEATDVAASFEVNASAKEYLVLRTP
jgi:hypothetical protein